MKLSAAALLAALGGHAVLAGVGDKCTFPDAGDSSDPSCVWNDYTAQWVVAYDDFRCCLEPAADNANCDPATNMILSQAQCDAINASNVACAANTTGAFAVGFTSTNWQCDDYAPDCLETLACDEENGFTGTPWINCPADGGVFEMWGCVRSAVDPDADNEVYLPYKYMNLDLGAGNAKSSLSSAAASCDETNCAAFTAGNGACNALGDCSTVGEYALYQDAEYTDLYPDVSTDVYVNPFRWIGPPMNPQVVTVSDSDDPDVMRVADLDFYSPMFDCFTINKGFFQYRSKTLAQIDASMSATGLVIDNFRFTQSLLDYVINDLGVDESLITTTATAKVTPDATADPNGSHEYFGKIDDGTLGNTYPDLAGKYVGGPLICNINNGQGCTIEGCAWMCQNTDYCDAFSILDFCYTGDVDPLRPNCDIVDSLVAASGGTATFDRSKRAVCAFHYRDLPDDNIVYSKDPQKSKAAVIGERLTANTWDDNCVAYNPNRCGECLECNNAGTDHWLNQGECEAGAPACNSARQTHDITAEWAYFKNDDTWSCDLCPKHCISCSDADSCSTCDSAAYEVNDAGTGCTEIGCTVDPADFPANSVEDANGAVSVACTNQSNIEPYDYCDIKCDTGFYQSAGSSLTAQCDGDTMLMDYPTITCSACSEVNCATCASDVCSECVEGYTLSAGSCDLVDCPLDGETGPDCTVCAASEYGTIAWDAATESWDTSGCRSCGNLLSNCLNCNGTSSANAVCIECASGYTLDENDDCIEEQRCPEGLEGVVFYNTTAGAFDFDDCTPDDACPNSGETAPDCWDCPDGEAGEVEWVWSNFTNGYWSESQCEVVDCPTAGEASPACTACPWGYSGTTYWDPETETWAGCVSNDFGLRRASESELRASARSTTPVLESRKVRATFSADGTVVEGVESAPYTLNRQSSAYFYKNNGAFSTAESVWNCAAGYGGADCSLRLCPHTATSFASGEDELSIGASEGLFWTTDIGQKSTATFHGRHVYRECAGRGICDYSTGECDCFPGFTGRGCRRHECPNSCSGHGVCVDDDLNLYHNTHAVGDVDVLDSDLYPATASSSDPNLWSANVQQGCVCDGGWTGHDCSLRLCPVGDDPETDCSDELAYDVQQITCTGLDKTVDHFFSAAYTTPLGTRYNTPPVIIHAFNVDDNVTSTTSSLQTALESLPNFAIPTVEVSMAFGSLAGSEFTANLLVTFSDPVNSGEQPLLEVTYSDRCDAGSSSYFENEDTSFACTVERVSASSTLREQAECSNRGLCNTRTGECACYDGYEGVACNTVSSTI